MTILHRCMYLTALWCKPPSEMWSLEDRSLSVTKWVFSHKNTSDADITVNKNVLISFVLIYFFIFYNNNKIFHRIYILPPCNFLEYVNHIANQHATCSV